LTQKAGYIDPAQLSLEFWAELVQIHIVPIREKLSEEDYKAYVAEGQAMDINSSLEYALDKSRD
jgi:hypothetical protein